MSKVQSNAPAGDNVESLQKQIMQGSLTRRQAMVRAASAGLGAAALAVLGGSSAFAQTPAASPAATPGGAGVSVSLPDATPDASVKTGGRLKMGLQADPAELDPQITNLTAAWHVIEHVYDGLVAVGKSLEPEPALATSWDISADGLTYTFHLRKGVKFHNGREFISKDVAYTFGRIVDPATASPNASDYTGVKSVATPDDYTAVFTLASADASFMAKLLASAAVIVPQEEVEKNGDLNNTMVGTGPFKFKEYIPNSSVTLDKNDDFWLPGFPYLDGLDMIIVSEATSRTAAVVQGTADFIEYAPVQDLPKFKDNKDYTVTGDQNTNIRYVAVNVSKAPLDKLEVRQAIAKVTDRNPIIQSAVFGYGTPMLAVFPDTYWAGLKTDIPAPDIDGAKALMQKAGITDTVKLRITSWSAYAFLSNAAVVLQEQLKQIGIDATLDLQENATYLDGYFNGDFDLSVTGTSAYIDPNDVIATNFKTGGDANGIKYSNPEVDKLIDQGVAETDQEKRAVIYQKIQQLLIDDLPWVNLFIANQYEVMKSYVKGYVHIATGTNTSVREVWLDK
jgi:peptide/nickel transport system substrate-binding protein